MAVQQKDRYLLRAQGSAEDKLEAVKMGLSLTSHLISLAIIFLGVAIPLLIDKKEVNLHNGLVLLAIIFLILWSALDGYTAFKHARDLGNRGIWHLQYSSKTMNWQAGKLLAAIFILGYLIVMGDSRENKLAASVEANNNLLTEYVTKRDSLGNIVYEQEQRIQELLQKIEAIEGMMQLEENNDANN